MIAVLKISLADAPQKLPMRLLALRPGDSLAILIRWLRQ